MPENLEIESEKAPFIFLRSASSMLLLWLAFPPIGFSFLGWFALLPLFHLVADKRELNKNGMRKIWFAGFLYWLATFYFIPIPHPALWAGWIVISLYLACYLPVFVFAARVLNRATRLPEVVSIPICWTGLEYARCHLFTGMGLVCLSHTQFEYPVVIQIADLSGAYTLTFAISFVAAAAAKALPLPRFRFWPSVVHIACVSVVLGGVYWYGTSKLDFETDKKFTSLKVGILQGSIDTVFPTSEEEQEKYYVDKTTHYRDLYHQAVRNWDSVDVVLWPENGWPVPDLHPDTDKTEMHPNRLQLYEESAFYAWTNLFIRGKNTPPIIAGAETHNPLNNTRYGSAIFVGDDGNVTNRYYKNHLVMFGEYVPLIKTFPLLERVTPIGTGLEAGTTSTTFDVNGVRIAPNICFESTVPHYVRHQVLELINDGQDPDILVNLTNDGWFYGTSCLDFHLACNVFRAVEMRKPHLVCANTGLSAYINEKGQIINRGPRRKQEAILADVSGMAMKSNYLKLGDGLPFSMAIITALAFIIGLIRNSGRRNSPESTVELTSAKSG